MCRLRKNSNALEQTARNREVIDSLFLEVLKEHRDMALRDVFSGHDGTGWWLVEAFL